MYMAKTWVLDTETKGTGASVVPLEQVLRRPQSEAKQVYVPPKGRPRPQPAPQQREPRAYRVVDLMTRDTLGEGDIRAAVDTLGEVRSAVDVNVYVWEPKRDRWRLLSLREKQALWEFRGR
jgi:hypothetical protein